MNDRKQQVLLTAQQLFIKNGFLTTTIQDILNKAEISKGTFYNYFSSKNECLIAILKHRDEEIFIRRQELLIGADISDKDILAKQILIRFQVNREQNLLPIFQAILHSEDIELRTFINKHHFKEIDWLAYRLIDIYGDEATESAFDGAVLFLGMIQQLFHVLKISTKEKIDTPEIIQFTMRRMDAMITNMIDTNDTVFQDKDFPYFQEKVDIQTYTKQQLYKKLTQFKSLTEKELTSESNEHIQFMIDEMDAENPRIFILQSVLRSFREHFIATPYKREAQKIAAHVWEYMMDFEK